MFITHKKFISPPISFKLRTPITLYIMKLRAITETEDNCIQQIKKTPESQTYKVLSYIRHLSKQDISTSQAGKFGYMVLQNHYEIIIRYGIKFIDLCDKTEEDSQNKGRKNIFIKYDKYNIYLEAKSIKYIPEKRKILILASEIPSIP